MADIHSTKINRTMRTIGLRRPGKPLLCLHEDVTPGITTQLARELFTATRHGGP